MEKKSNGFLKVTGILMIIGGAVGTILNIGTVACAGILSAAADAAGVASELNTGLLLVATILMLVGAIVQLIAGIIGVANAAKPEKAGVCIVFGALVAILSVVGNILTSVAGGAFSIPLLFTGLILPALYLVGAFQNKAKAA